ncbi:MAG: elongation factor G [Firmicutes bacterium]|nr:elongation factor G [Bacillota bacterium]
MKRYGADTIKNVGLISHGGAGKTSLAEAMLFDCGVTERLGRTEDGNTVMDYDPEEIRRKVSINTSIAPAEWSGVKINILDTPGYFDFVGEVKSALRVVDGAIVLADAVAGVEVGTELVWQYADERRTPRIVVVNKMDRENANFDAVLESLRKSFGKKVIPFQVPIGQEASFRGVVDLVEMKGITYEDGEGRNPRSGAVPAELQRRVEELRAALIESAAENDDDLLMKYLDGGELAPEEMRSGIRKGVLSGKVVPVFCASSGRNIGIQPILDAVVSYLPSPADLGEAVGFNPKTREQCARVPGNDAPFSALVFKTMADPYVGRLTVFRVYSGVLKSDSQVLNTVKDRTERIGQVFLLKGKQQEAVPEIGAGDIGAVAKLQETTTNDTLSDAANPIAYEPTEFPAPIFSVAVQPKSKGDEDKISSSLARMTEEDPTLRVERNPQTLQTILSGMGELHLDVVTERLKRKFGVDVTLDTPKVPYKETIKGTTKVEGKHKKQTGGRGQYGHVFLEISPLEPGKEFEFVDKIFGGAVPRQYIPAVEKGVREAMQEGVLAGYPVTDVRVTLYDGSYHPVDSSEMAFKIAASMAFKKGCLEARPVMLEPIMKVEVMIPDQFMGDVMGDLNKKRGKIVGMEPRGSSQVIKALAPLAEMARYAIDLRSMTQGRGTYTMEFSHYEEVPVNVAEALIEQARKEKESQAK